MKNSRLVSFVAFAVMFVLALTSSILGGVTTGTFAYFELLYLLTLLLGMLLCFSSKKNPAHLYGGALLVNVGYLANTLVYCSKGFSMASAILNGSIAFFLLFELIYFSHAHHNIHSTGKYMLVPVIILSALILASAITVFFTSDPSSKDSLGLVNLIVSCLSLLSTIGLPLAQLSIIKSQK